MAIGPSRRGRWSKPERGLDGHRRRAAVEEEALLPKLAGLRPSSPNASGFVAEGRSTTHCDLLGLAKPDDHEGRSAI